MLLTDAELGYKLRTHISKALQTWSHAIWNALERYNAAAAKLKPPRELLMYSSIIEYSFVGDFSLLRTSWEDIQLQQWVRPAVCEAMTKHFQLECAHEEIIQLNIEICCLHTAVHDESEDVAGCIDKLTCSNDALDALLAEEICCWWQLKSRINALHTNWLCTIENTFGFSGVSGCGLRQGCSGDCRMPGVDTARDLVVEELSEEPGGQYAVDKLLHDFERLGILVTKLD